MQACADPTGMRKAKTETDNPEKHDGFFVALDEEENDYGGELFCSSFRQLCQ
jgi:hypothetical protein